MKNILKQRPKNIISTIVTMVGILVLLFMGAIIYQTYNYYFQDFVFRLDPASGEPYVKGNKLDSQLDEGFQDGATYELIEIPEKKVAEVKKILNGESLSQSSMDSWKLYQAQKPLEGDFDWCESYADKNEWLEHKPLPDTRFILTNPELKQRQEFSFVIVDLALRKIFICHGNH